MTTRNWDNFSRLITAHRCYEKLRPDATGKYAEDDARIFKRVSLFARRLHRQIDKSGRRMTNADLEKMYKEIPFIEPGQEQVILSRCVSEMIEQAKLLYGQASRIDINARVAQKISVTDKKRFHKYRLHALQILLDAKALGHVIKDPPSWVVELFMARPLTATQNIKLQALREKLKKDLIL